MALKELYIYIYIYIYNIGDEFSFPTAHKESLCLLKFG
jgi:hypothetical protein